MRNAIAFLLLLLTGPAFSQVVPINSGRMLELKDMAMAGDRFYAVGCAIHSPTYIPAVVCFDLNGDTLWLREFPNLCDRGSFAAVRVLQDSVYVIGNGTHGQFSEDVSFMLRLTTSGDLAGGRISRGVELAALYVENGRIWITGRAFDSESRKGLFVLHGKASLEVSDTRVYHKSRSGASTGAAVTATDKWAWICGTCSPDNKNEQFTVTRLDRNMDSIGTSRLFTERRGECQVICTDTKNRVWAAGKAKLKTTAGMGVACFNEKGDTLFTQLLNPGERWKDAHAIVAASNGDIHILSSEHDQPFIYTFRDLELYGALRPEQYKDHRMMKMIEYEPGKFVILCLQLVGQFYGQSALIFWEPEK